MLGVTWKCSQARSGSTPNSALYGLSQQLCSKLKGHDAHSQRTMRTRAPPAPRLSFARTAGQGQPANRRSPRATLRGRMANKALSKTFTSETA
ncbi:hypothetical protein XA68_13128 [Ophiocordyceps unilateralis]|uniref:Uncharacterized protein n=1 Tax=Ophiocordyceps unilateralis TaxID=268505 RepID=A0A2A9PP07_OPHUN|nr:hypothetical protein XA68_13128 [Ophiocordyceps unilateralis]